MLGKYWQSAIFLLLVLSLIFREALLVLILLLVCLAGGVSRLWNHYCLSRVEYRRHLSSSRVFFGEEVQLEVEIANRKLLPLPWLQIDDGVPEEVTFLKGRTSAPLGEARPLLRNLITLGWYHRVKRRYPLKCLRRGYFAFGPARIRSGDLFGFFSREMNLPQTDYLMVYPRIVPLAKLGIPSREPLGDILVRSDIFQDPILTLGVRDYQSGDSLKRIHWKSTARSGKLQTRVFETTTTVDVGLFFDVRTTKLPLRGVITDRLELGIVAAASLASYALAHGHRVGLYVNQNRRFTGQPLRLPSSQSPDQLRQILEALAGVHSWDTMPISQVVRRESVLLSWGSTLVVISAAPTGLLVAILLKMKRAGRRVVLVVVGGEKPAEIGGLSVFHIGDDVKWSETEQLSIVSG
ncbi:MAG: DUF58 domain-containing protein [Chloroflexota bacterium]